MKSLIAIFNFYTSTFIKIFGKNNVSIESIVQLDASEDKAEIVVITHEVNNGDFEKSKEEINTLNEVKIIASQLSCI